MFSPTYVRFNLYFCMQIIKKWLFMDKSILQSLLDAQIFTLPDNDERLTQLETSATQLAEKLQENVSDIPFYTLVALDPNITGTEPVIVEVENIIRENWTTIRSNRPDSPISIIRSVILSALNTIGSDNTDCAQIIYLTATNFHPYAALGNEKEIVEKILLNIGEFAEQNANTEWALGSEIPELKLPSLKITFPKIGTISVNQAEIEKSFTISTIKQSNYGGAEHSTTNAAFTKLKTEVPSAIASSIDTAFKSFSGNFDFKDFDSSINKFFSDFKKSLDKELKVTFTAMQAVERRSRLLWWKESLYSQHFKKSYRETGKELRPVVMAFDLFGQLPNITPVSVDYLLRDTHFQLNDKTHDAVKFSDLLSAIEKSSNKTSLNGCFNGQEIENKDRRITITDFIYLLVEGEVKSKDLLKHTGIDPKKTVTPCDLSVMVLHDLLSNRIAES
ncbi:hypothetical protein EZS27_019336 [termite gut metagenome]|uniref:GTPase-associated system helical domain-containing protein n=1 Tax=termite gut metagenome TaxID=433724 RepID=A0A5J4RDE5_9ZZZZ